MGDTEVTGQATSGQFCQTGTSYTIYFAAMFNRPFSTEGTWATSVSPGSRQCSGTRCGAYVSFGTMSNKTVLMKVGISFASVADAEANVAAEDPGWSLQRGPGQRDKSMECDARQDPHRRGNPNRPADLLHRALSLTVEPERRERRQRRLHGSRRSRPQLPADPVFEFLRVGCLPVGDPADLRSCARAVR